MSHVTWRMPLCMTHLYEEVLSWGPHTYICMCVYFCVHLLLQGQASLRPRQAHAPLHDTKCCLGFTRWPAALAHCWCMAMHAPCLCPLQMLHDMLHDDPLCACACVHAQVEATSVGCTVTLSHLRVTSADAQNPLVLVKAGAHLRLESCTVSGLSRGACMPQELQSMQHASGRDVQGPDCSTGSTAAVQRHRQHYSGAAAQAALQRCSWRGMPVCPEWVPWGCALNACSECVP